MTLFSTDRLDLERLRHSNDIGSIAPSIPITGTGESLPLESVETSIQNDTTAPEDRDSDIELADRDEHHEEEEYPDDRLPPSDRIPEVMGFEQTTGKESSLRDESAKSPKIFKNPYTRPGLPEDEADEVNHSDKKLKLNFSCSIATKNSSPSLSRMTSKIYQRSRAESFSELSEQGKRDHATNALMKVLRQNIDGNPSQRIAELAQKIENACFEYFGGTTPAYRVQIRDLMSNLSDASNPGLKKSVLSQKLSAKQLAKMSNFDMANKELHLQREYARKEDLEDHLEPIDSFKGQKVYVASREDGVVVRKVDQDGRIMREGQDEVAANPRDEELLR